jgi:hypothetical protein
MSKRVLLGKKGSTYGLFISKPGVDVTTANADQLIFDSTAKGYGQAIFKETITLSRGTSQTRTFSTQNIPNPTIIILGEQFVQVSNVTGTQATFLVPNYYSSMTAVYSTNIFTTGTTTQTPASTTITYMVIRGHI